MGTSFDSIQEVPTHPITLGGGTGKAKKKGGDSVDLVSKAEKDTSTTRAKGAEEAPQGQAGAGQEPGAGDQSRRHGAGKFNFGSFKQKEVPE